MLSLLGSFGSSRASTRDGTGIGPASKMVRNVTMQHTQGGCWNYSAKTKAQESNESPGTSMAIDGDKTPNTLTTEKIMELLKDLWSDDEFVIVRALIEIANIGLGDALSNENEVKIRVLGGHTAVFQVLQKHVSCLEIQEEGMCALGTLSYLMPTKKLLGDIGCVEVILARMEKYPYRKRVQWYGSAITANLVSGMKDNAKRFDKSGGIALVITAMKAHPRNEMVQDRGCMVLSNMSEWEEYRFLIVEAGGASVIASVIEKHRAHPKLGARAYNAAERLTKKHSCRTLLKAKSKRRHSLCGTSMAQDIQTLKGCASDHFSSTFSSSGSLITRRSDIRTIPNEAAIEVVEPGTDGGYAAKPGTGIGGAAKPTRRHSLGSTPLPSPFRQRRTRLAADLDPETGQKKGKPPRQRRSSLVGGLNKPNRTKEIQQPSIELLAFKLAEAGGSNSSLSSSTLTGEDSTALLETGGKYFKSPNANGQKLHLSDTANMKVSAPSTRMHRIRSPRRKEYEKNKSGFQGKQTIALKEKISISTMVQHRAIVSLEDMLGPSAAPPSPSQNIKSNVSQLPPLPIDLEARTVRSSNRKLDNVSPLSGSNPRPSSPWGRAKTKASIRRLPLSPSSSSKSSNYPIPERRVYWADKIVSQRLSISKTFDLGPVTETSAVEEATVPATRHPQLKCGSSREKLEEDKTRQEKLRARIQSASIRRASSLPRKHSTFQAY